MELLWNKMLYLGNAHFVIHNRSDIIPVDIAALKKAWLVILGKKYYFETVRTFPFSTMRDIRDAVMMDISTYAPFETQLMLLRKRDLPDGGCRVNLWFVHPDAMAHLRRLSTVFVMPESALLSLTPDSKETMYHLSHSEWDTWIGIGSDHLSQSVFAARGQINHEKMVRILGGNAGAFTVFDMSDIQSYVALLHASLRRLPVTSLMPFVIFEKSAVRMNAQQIKWGIAGAAGLLMLYMGISAYIPYHVKSGFIAEEKQLTGQINTLIEKQRQVDQYEKKRNELVENMRSYTPKLPLLLMLNAILPEKTTIQELTMARNVVEIKGLTPKTTDFLDILSRRPEIQNARFTASVREEKGTSLEVFSLGFNYNPEKITR